MALIQGALNVVQRIMRTYGMLFMIKLSNNEGVKKIIVCFDVTAHASLHRFNESFCVTKSCCKRRTKKVESWT